MTRPNAIEQAAIRYTAERGADAYAALRVAIEAKFPGAIDRQRAKAAKERQERVFVGKVPAWAKRLALKHAKRELVRLTWRVSRIHQQSTGRCWSWQGQIVITAGSDAEDQKVTLLHELAHLLDFETGHTESFYDTMYRLVKAEGLIRAATATHGHTRGMKAAARRARKEGSR